MSRIGKAALVVSAGILASRILGLLRNVAVAALLGDTTDGDLYQAAFVLPDLLFYLMAGGYLSITFIPILAERMAADDEEGTWSAFASIAKAVGAAMVLLTVVTWIAAPSIVQWVFGRLPALATEGTTAIPAADLSELAGLVRIVLPAQLFFMLGSLLMGVQYAKDRFLIPSLAPVVYNLGIIFGGLIGWWSGVEGPAGFLWGALLGAATGNFALQVWGARRVGLRWVSAPIRSPALRAYLLMALPLMLGQSVAILDEQLIRVAGQLGPEGTIATLGLARNLVMVPVGLIAQAAGVAAYPTLARLVAAGALDDMRETLTRALRGVLLFGGLATAAVLAASQPAVAVVYQRGAFGVDATIATAAALVFYALAIPFWGGHQLLGRAFYAHRRMWVPVGIGTMVTVVAIPLYFSIEGVMGAHGIALASTAAISLYTVALGAAWFRAHGGWRPVGDAVWRTAVATTIAAAGGWAAVDMVVGEPMDGWLGQASLGLVVGAVVVTGLYAASLRVLRVPEVTAIGDRLRNRLG
ncbi:MAG: murein biosynthesis integral membrane protein MurJ [Acidimicrobiia bacterium]|nr:MAG: murein biosynthesis integral membrane protein MurJ [Acidimicrobiia bacterium]